MDVYIQEGRIEKVRGNRDHPLNEGKLCVKGYSAKDIVQSESRVTTPLKKVSGDWWPITWDEALDICAENLQDLKDQYGPQSLAVIIGMPVLLGGNTTVSFLRRFCDVFGTPNCFSVESMCFRCRIIANILTLGKFPAADISNAQTILVWGNNPHASNPPASWRIEKARKSGSRVITVDPVQTEIAKQSDIHLQLRPGTDSALALGMMAVIIDEGIFDQEFVADWTRGFDELQKVVSGYSPRQVEKITGVPAEKIRDAARLFATNKPSCIQQGTNSLDQHPNGLQNSRALAILFSITGNVDIEGGMLTTSRVRIGQLRMPERMQGKPLGVERFPLFYDVWGKTFGEGQAMELLEDLLSGESSIRGMIISACNPMLTWPDSEKIEKALRVPSFKAVMDTRLTQTARHCDLFLPAATFLERTELCDYYGTLHAIPFVTLRRKLFQAGEAMSDVQFWFELGKRMGYEDLFPWGDVDEALDEALKPSGLTVQDLTSSHGGLPFGEKRIDYFREKGFPTPSKKVELYSETLQELGLDPIPVHRESPQSPVCNEAMARSYPLILITGSRTVEYLHSEYRDIAKLRERRPEAEAQIHPQTAQSLNVLDGETVVLENPQGTISIRACVTEDILPGVVSVPHGWEEPNINMLTQYSPVDPATGYPLMKSMLCRIRKQ
jgi:anaerobic selenocysteine-containing dehydrogenase